MYANRKRFFQRALAIVALAALVLPTAGFGSAAQAAQAKKVMKYDGGGEPDTIDPSIGSYANDISYDHAMFATLLRYDKDNNPSPYLAKEVPTIENGEISKDGKTYTYKLRTDWKWSDGNGVVKASDVVYAFQRYYDPKNASQYIGFLDPFIVGGADVTTGKNKDLTSLGIKADDAAATVTFSLLKPTPYFNSIATMWFMTALRKDNVERAGLPDPTAWLDPANGPVVGTGPFILTKWDHNKDMIFVRNPNFGGNLAKLDELDVQLIQDAAVSFASYKAGELDLGRFPAAEYPGILADATLSKQLINYTQSSTWWLTMDNTKPPFNNKKVREAFTYAVDRDQYVKVIGKGLETKELSFLPDGVYGYSKDVKTYDFNPDLARKTLADAGYPNGKGFPPTNWNYVAGAGGQRSADYLVQQFHDVLNVDLVENPMDNAVYQAATSGAIDKIPGMALRGWGSDYLHASDWNLPVMGCGPAGVGNSTNIAGYCDPAFDKAATVADNELDPTKTLADYKAAQQILLDDFPVVFMFNTVAVVLINPRVKLSSLRQSSLDDAQPGSYAWEDVDLN